MSKRYQGRTVPVWCLSLFGGSALFAAASGLAQTAPTEQPPSTSNAKQLQSVVVTGTRASNRTVAESLSPIDVLSPADLQSSGNTDIASALGRLLPSLDFPRPAINDGNDALRPATLRGLSPDHVLVLVDGKRYHTSSLVNYNPSVGRGSAPVDLNSIPIAAIDHIEVLRDGAAAQYGSDAIAGVINIVLKHGGSGGQVTASGGVMDKGDGAQNGLEASLGVPLGKDGDLGWWRVALNYQSAMKTNRAEYGLQDPASNGGVEYQRYGDPGVKTLQALTNFSFVLAPKVDLYGYINMSRRNVDSNGYYRTAGSGRNVPAIYPNGYLPHIVNATNDVAAVLGVKGISDGGWHWDVSGNYGVNRLNFDVRNSLNVALYNTLGYTPTQFHVGKFRTTQGVFNLDVSKEVEGWLPNALNVAFGAEYRRDGYNIYPGDPSSYYGDPAGAFPTGSQVYPGLTPQVSGNFSRNSKAAYLDLETDLSSKLSVGLAGRYENYSDAGSTRSGKLSARYQFTDTFALRGTASNGFRAPSLAQQNYESVVSIIQNQQLVQVGTYRTASPEAIALGAKQLKPEKSSNYSIGAVWQPTNDFNAVLDLYQIRIWHQILYSDQIDLIDNPALFAYFNSVVPNSQVSAAQYFANAATTRTRGADLVTNYRMDLGDYGNLRLNLGANYNHTKVLNVIAPPHQLTDHVPGIQLFGRASQGILTAATPRTKYIIGGDWLYRGFDLHTNLTRYGAIERLGDTPAGDQHFSARWLLDMSLSYKLQDWSFTVGGDNITNQYPTRVTPNNAYDYYNGEIPYSPLSPFGFNGRYWYAKVSYHW
ncbi:TonB-dependent receptor plug domain-containing protein [Dyella tabacisoli]|uniref:TonB-dependent receptor n=1 Tax=Dyella tabacisoli TaxID=2282381 RepID=A0A369ULN3_9GAMM|nr:TonB-dependent receptor [Dyella tabacisoli]RDD80510.1 TonB-dependent receptor [Dyella tabacisoli]